MVQTRLGALRSRARALGITSADYATRILLGEKHCWRCARWRSRSLFGADRSRSDGRDAICLACRESKKRRGPGRRERKQRRSIGEGWCRACEKWHRGIDKRGLCREHARANERQRYSSDTLFREDRKNRAAIRTRGVPLVPPDARISLLEEFSGECAYCTAAPDSWDHVVPVSRGGLTEPWNIVPACRSCNSRKRARDPYEWLDRITDPEKVARVVDRMSLAEMPTAFHAAACE